MKVDETTIHKSHGDKFLEFVLETVNSGVIILNGDLTVVFANSKARHLLRVADSLVGLSFKDLFLQEDQKILVPNLVKVTEKQGEFEGDIMIKQGNGQGIIAHISMASWKQNDELTHVVTLSDMSRLKDIENMLHSSERMIYLGEMLDDISHQIRNPVLSIGGFARRLMGTRIERPEYVRVIIEEARRLELLLDVLTKFIQLPQPRFALYKAQKVTDMAREQTREVCDTHGVHLRLSTLYDSSRKVVTDLELLEKALRAVVVNGCEACRESDGDALVHVAFEQDSGNPWTLKISVTDTGQGIRPPLMERIFHPFFTTKTGHLGMGLTFSKRIMEEIGGRIEVKSTLGKGTCVTLKLPGDRRKKIRTSPL